MKIIGIICEYNPLHRGHEKQLRYLKATYPGCAVVCLMSGNFVQRGHPAMFDRSLRAKAAILSGADLVLELPVTYALSSAEGFAAGGVSILGKFCDGLCFGSESGDKSALLATAQALLAEDFPSRLRQELQRGLSFPAARQAALGPLGAVLEKPNDILAVEYCKAILSHGGAMEPVPILRPGDYHAGEADPENPSATAVRQRILRGEDWQSLVSHSQLYENEPVHTLAAGERAVLYRLRTMTDSAFEALPYGSEGLWRKLMHASRSQATLEEILTATKSKRYTRTRLDRMVLCAALGITHADLMAPAPYTRVLALNDTGREVLKLARATGRFLNVGEKAEEAYQQLETRCGDLYGLFAQDTPDPPAADRKTRIYCEK